MQSFAPLAYLEVVDKSRTLGCFEIVCMICLYRQIRREINPPDTNAFIWSDNHRICNTFCTTPLIDSLVQTSLKPNQNGYSPDECTNIWELLSLILTDLTVS